jgi:hypothetical protein
MVVYKVKAVLSEGRIFLTGKNFSVRENNCSVRGKNCSTPDAELPYQWTELFYLGKAVQ